MSKMRVFLFFCKQMWLESECIYLHSISRYTVCVYSIFFFFCKRRERGLPWPEFHPTRCQLPSLCFPHTEPFRHDQLLSSTFHLIITSLVDKDAHKNGELFDSGRIELFVTSLLKDISQIQTLTDFVCRMTLTPRRCFPPLFWFEVKKTMAKKTKWVDGWIKGLSALALRLSQELICFPYFPELLVREMNLADQRMVKKKRQMTVEYVILKEAFFAA